MKTPYEMLFKRKPDNSRIRVFGCTSYVHVHKPNHTSKLGNHSQKGRFLGNSNGLHRVQVLNDKHDMETKHVSFAKRHFVFPPDTTVYVDIDTRSVHISITSDVSTVNEKRDDNDCHIMHAVYKNSEVPLSKGASDPEEKEKENTDTKEIPANDERMSQERRSATRERKTSIRFTINSLNRTRGVDEPTVRKAVSSLDAPIRDVAMREELRILEEMNGWE